MAIAESTVVGATVTVSCVVLLIICLLAAVLILWRCYYVKRHKHNTSLHTAAGEGQYSSINPLQQDALPPAQDQENHQKIKTGTNSEIEVSSVLYSSVNEIPIGQCSPEEIAIPITHHCEGGETFEKCSAEDKNVSSVDQLYAQVDKKKKKDGHIYTPDAETPVDQLYARVDNNKKKDGNTTIIHLPEAETPVDQLYAQVDKKRKKVGGTTCPQTQESETAVDHLYAQVDKKRKNYGDFRTLEAETVVDQDGDITHHHAHTQGCRSTDM
jgi:hypothetical protein